MNAIRTRLHVPDKLKTRGKEVGGVDRQTPTRYLSWPRAGERRGARDGAPDSTGIVGNDQDDAGLHSREPISREPNSRGASAGTVYMGKKSAD